MHLAQHILIYENLYNKGVLLHRWRITDYGAAAYLIRRKFAERLINYFFGKGDNMKIDLKKCYEIEGDIVADNIIYDFAQTLVFTFPLCYQDVNLPSEMIHLYNPGASLERVNQNKIVKNLWSKYFN